VTDEPEFLTLDEILEIHRDQIERYGGDEGIRDSGLLESAVAMPQQSFGGEYLHRDIFEMAAAYAFHRPRTKHSSTGTSGRASRQHTCSLR
jgi:death-on-curing protein